MSPRKRTSPSHSPAPPPRIKTGRVLWAVAAAVMLLAVEVRVWASLDDFWLDEIWSWMFAAEAPSAVHLFTQVRHDNNHFLNTWILYLLGPDRPWIVYRLPAVAAGVATVALSGFTAWRWGRVEALTALAITGGSFLLIQYSSEARGYAYALLFTVALWELAQRSFETRRVGCDGLFAACAVLGFLAHVTFVCVYAALVGWGAWRLLREEHAWPKRAAMLVGWLLIPLSFLGWLAWVNLRHLAIGGGDVLPWTEVITQTLSLAVGGPWSGPAAAVTAAAVVIAAAAGLYQMHRAGLHLWLPLTAGAFLLPALVLLVTQPAVVYPRYFLVNVLLLQLLLAWLLAQVYRRGRLGQLLYALALAAMLAGNVVWTARLLEHGRGGYQAAVERLLAHTPGDTLTVGSDHDFRNGLVLHFYYQRSGSDKRLTYYRRNQWPAGGPQWVLTHSFARDFSPAPTLHDDAGNRYRLEAVYPYAGLSGWHWALYRNAK